MSSPILPLEIVDYILHEIERSCYSLNLDYKTTVKACSLVCSNWRHSSQSRLFSSITIEQCQKNVEFVICVAQGDTNAVRLAQHIRFIRLADAPTSHGTRCHPLPVPLPHQEPYSSLASVDYIISFLNQLQIVHGLSLKLNTTWDFLGLAGNKALLRLIRLPSLMTIELDILYGAPISLLPLLGDNIQKMYICGLSWEKPPQVHPKAILDCNDLQGGYGPRPVHIDVANSSDLKPLIIVSSTFLTSLRSISLPMLSEHQWNSEILHLRMFFESCPHLTKITVGQCEGSSPCRGFKFECPDPLAPSIQNSSISQFRCHVTQSMSYDKKEHDMFLKLGLELLRKTLPITTSPLPPTSFPTNLPLSTPARVVRRLSDDITSLTLNYRIFAPAHNQHSIHIFQPFHDMWSRTDGFLDKLFFQLQSLSVNLDMCIPGARTIHEQVDSLISKVGNSFPRMSTRLGGTGGEESRFMINVKSTIIS